MFCFSNKVLHSEQCHIFAAQCQGDIVYEAAGFVNRSSCLYFTLATVVFENLAFQSTRLLEGIPGPKESVVDSHSRLSIKTHLRDRITLAKTILGIVHIFVDEDSDFERASIHFDFPFVRFRDAHQCQDG